jgi:hypothetical protein
MRLVIPVAVILLVLLVDTAAAARRPNRIEVADSSDRVQPQVQRRRRGSRARDERTDRRPLHSVKAVA